MQPSGPMDPAPGFQSEAESRPGVLARIPPVPFAVITLCIIFLLYQLVGGVATFLVIGTTVNDENVDTARWLTLSGQLVFILIPTIILKRLRYSRGPGFPAIRMASLKEFGLVLLSVFSLQQVLQGYMAVQDTIPLPEDITRLLEPFKNMIEETYRVLVTSTSFSEFLFVVIVVAVVPAFVEELLFRGLIQTNLGRVFGDFRAAVVVGLVFAAYHLVPFTFIPLAILGIYFGYLVYRSGNLALAVTAHFFNNFLACLAMYLQMNEDFVVMSPVGEASSILLLLNSVLFLAIFLLTLLAFHRMTERSSSLTMGSSA